MPYVFYGIGVFYYGLIFLSLLTPDQEKYDTTPSQRIKLGLVALITALVADMYIPEGG